MTTANLHHTTRQASAARLLALAVLIAIALGLYVGLRASHHGKIIFQPRFRGSGLVTNEYAYFNPRSPLAVRSSDWVVTSGSLFALDGGGWTGVPDGRDPNATSSSATDSAVFRLRTRRADFENVVVSFDLRVARFVTTPRTPAQTYDGVHVWLRYQDANWLYFASVSRRDGEIVIGKKLPAQGGGRYYHLVRVPGHLFPLGRWEHVQVAIDTKGTTVVIRVDVDGGRLAVMVDDGRQGQTILRSGAVGIRGDNADFRFKSFEVRAP